MPRPISGETHTYRVNVKQRSGVYYVYERTERYENGRMRKVGKDVLIGKILPNDPEHKVVPTRPKKKSAREIANAIASGSVVSAKNKTIAGKKQKLLTWLNKQSLYSLIAWFDAIEETNVSSQIKSRRWNTEVLERDHMFLSMLGVTAFD